MARYTASGLTYSDACNLITALKDIGVNANITVGAVSIWGFSPDQIPQIQEVCKRFNTQLDAGDSAQVEDVLMTTEAGRQDLIQSTGDAASVLQEWRE